MVSIRLSPPEIISTDSEISGRDFVEEEGVRYADVFLLFRYLVTHLVCE